MIGEYLGEGYVTCTSIMCLLDFYVIAMMET